MLKRLIPLLVIAVSAITASAQTPGFRIGPHPGIGQSNFRTDSLPGETGRLMRTAGLHASYQFNKMIAIEAEGMFVSKGAKASGRRTLRASLFLNRITKKNIKCTISKCL